MSQQKGKFSLRRRKRVGWALLAVFCCFLSIAWPIGVHAIPSLRDPALLLPQAQERYRGGQFEESAEIWQKLADIFADRGDRLNQAMALANLSLSQQQMGKWPDAQEAIANALALLQTLDRTPESSRILASAWNIQGQLFLATGQPEKALQSWQQSGDLYQNTGDRSEALGARINQAQALQNLGLYPRACQILLDVLEIGDDTCEIGSNALAQIRSSPNLPQKILALRSLGNVLRVTGKLESAQSVLLKSWQLSREIANYPDLAAIYLNLGHTARAIARRQSTVSGRSPVAIERSPDCTALEPDTTAQESDDRARDCYRRAGVSDAIAPRAKVNELSLAIDRGQSAAIPSLLAEIPPLLDRSPPSAMDVRSRLKFAASLLCLRSNLRDASFVSPLLQSCPFRPGEPTGITEIRDGKAIAEILTTALERAQLLGDRRALADSLGHLGALAGQNGNITEARRFTEQALQILSSFDAPDRTYFWQWQLGRIFWRSGRKEEAIALYTLAWETLQSLRRDLVAIEPDVQFTFRDSVEPVYRELVDLLLQGDNPAANALKKAREIIESLQLAELNNFFREACIEARPQQIDTIDPDAAVIYGIILPNRLAVIVSLSDGVPIYYSTPLTRGEREVEEAFDDLLATLNPYLSSPDDLQPSQRFYDWLIRPVAARLAQKGVKNLVFVLDGILRGLPTAVLHDGRQYLLENYNLALTAGLQLLSPRSLAFEPGKVLAGGITESRSGFSALPEVGREVKEISEITDTEVLLDGRFTRARLEETLRSQDFSIVHLATHGQFSSRAENTFVLTWDERVNVKNLDRLLREGMNRPDRLVRPIELLILSACQSAVGDKRATLGLAGVAARSRARATVATLWSVDDRSTADLMIEFYHRLKGARVNKAAALRQAQLVLMRSPRYHHPYYWAPFVLVGNWL
jgi:CHAT domain-containing protein